MKNLESIELQDIEQALNKNEFILDYQPVLNIKSNKVVNVEALVRWQHPSHGIISPGLFIQAAIDKGIIEDLTTWILNEACQQLSKWQDKNNQVTLAVNIPGQLLLSNSFIRYVENLISEYSISPNSLIFEITENQALENQVRVLTSMNQLKQIGIKFALDDFGKGYSNLTYLKTYPFDIIKIDKYFIKDISTCNDSKIILHSIITMLNKLNFSIVIEGVESREQHDFAKKLGVILAQGYYYSNPLSFKDFFALI